MKILFVDGVKMSRPLPIISVNTIRTGIRIQEEQELRDNEVDMAIIWAITRLSLKGITAEPNISDPQLWNALFSLACYKAYQIYSDRIVNILQGSYLEQPAGEWKPIGDEILRNTEAKLKQLKQDADEALASIEVGVEMIDIRTPDIEKVDDYYTYPKIFESNERRSGWSPEDATESVP